MEKKLRDAVAQAPKNAMLLIQLADLLDRRNQYQQAETFYRQALDSEPRNPVALNNLAWLLTHRTTRHTEALTCIDRAIAVVGPRGDLLDTRAVVLLNLNKPEPALGDLDEAMAERPTPVRCFHLARAHYLARNLEKAGKAMEQAQQLGFQPSQLHPIEQEDCSKLLKELGQK
jgi:Tfp pilus assembly protein PilF